MSSLASSDPAWVSVRRWASGLGKFRSRGDSTRLGDRFRSARLEVALALLVFLLALAPRLPGLAIFWTADEPFFYDFAQQFGRALRAADWTETLGPTNGASVPSVTTRWQGLVGLGLGHAHRSALQSLGLLPASSTSGYPRGLQSLAVARLPGVAFSALVVLAAYVVLRRTVGLRAACFAAVFLALDPFYIALSRVLGNDALHAGFALLAVLAVGLTFLRGDRRWMLAFGACTGLAVLSKSPALVLLPLLPVLAVLLNYALLERRRSILWWVGAVACGYMSAAVVTLALWPALWVRPVTAAQGIFSRAQLSLTAGSFFLGRPTADPGPLYYPLAVAFRLNPFVLLGVAAALAAVALWLRHGAHRPAPARVVWIALLGVMALSYLALFSFAPSKSDRYALPAILAINMIGALGLLGLLDWLAAMFRRNARTLTLVAGLIVTAYGVYTCARAYPYYFPAYNQLLGGLPAAARVELVGWGEGIDRVASYLNSQPNASSLLVGGHILVFESDYFRGRKTLSRPRPLEQLDYYVDYISWRQRNMVPLGFDDLVASTPPEYVVEIDGVPYVSLYRIPKDRYRALPPGAVPVDATYSDDLRLAGYGLQPLRRTASGRPQVWASLYWQTDASCDRNEKLRVSLVNAAGTAWGERTIEPPCGDPFGWRDDLMVRQDVSLDVLPGTPPGDYNLRATMIDTRNGYEVHPSSGATVTIGAVTLPRDAPIGPDAVDMEHALDARFGDAIRLLGYDVAGSSRADDTLAFTAYWQSLRPPDRRYRVFINLLDRTGKVVAARDAEPVDGLYPTDAWTADEVIRDGHHLAFADDRAADAVAVEIGLYDPASGERLPVTLANGEQPPNRALRIGGR